MKERENVIDNKYIHEQDIKAKLHASFTSV